MIASSAGETADEHFVVGGRTEHALLLPCQRLGEWSMSIHNCQRPAAAERLAKRERRTRTIGGSGVSGGSHRISADQTGSVYGQPAHTQSHCSDFEIESRQKKGKSKKVKGKSDEGWHAFLTFAFYLLFTFFRAFAETFFAARLTEHQTEAHNPSLSCEASSTSDIFFLEFKQSCVKLLFFINPLCVVIC